LAVRVFDLALIADAMARFRAAPPQTLGGARVTQVDDLAEGGNGLPPTDGLRFVTAEDVRVIVRPSGTEPKLKCYLEAIVPVYKPGDLPGARAKARARLDGVRADLERLIEG
jgi:phosphomannomutase